jgi:hypothetical protein
MDDLEDWLTGLNSIKPSAQLETCLEVRPLASSLRHRQRSKALKSDETMKRKVCRSRSMRLVTNVANNLTAN